MFKKKKSFKDMSSMQSMKSFDRNRYFAPPLYNISKGLSLTASSILPNRQPQPFYEAQGYNYPHPVQQQAYYPQLLQPQQRLFNRAPLVRTPELIKLKQNSAVYGPSDGGEPFVLFEKLVKRPNNEKIVEEKQEKTISKEKDDGFVSIGIEKWDSE